MVCRLCAHSKGMKTNEDSRPSARRVWKGVIDMSVEGEVAPYKYTDTLRYDLDLGAYVYDVLDAKGKITRSTSVFGIAMREAQGNNHAAGYGWTAEIAKKPDCCCG